MTSPILLPEEPKRKARDSEQAASVRVELPFPVPLRALWIKSKGGGGIPTPRYQNYGKSAFETIAQQKPGKMLGKVSVLIRLRAPDKRARDGDNLLKCVMDTLKNNGLIEDDSNRFVVRGTWVWAEDGPPCVVLIQPVEQVAA